MLNNFVNIVHPVLLNAGKEPASPALFSISVSLFPKNQSNLQLLLLYKLCYTFLESFKFDISYL